MYFEDILTTTYYYGSFILTKFGSKKKTYITCKVMSRKNIWTLSWKYKEVSE